MNWDKVRYVGGMLDLEREISRLRLRGGWQTQTKARDASSDLVAKQFERESESEIENGEGRGEGGEKWAPSNTKSE